MRRNQETSVAYMPFEAHPLFDEPKDASAKIWRYMDFTKFVSLLETASLFFVRADRLAQIDPFEGRLTNADVAARSEFLSAKYSDAPAEEWDKVGIKSEENLISLQRMFRQSDPISAKISSETVFINSWHMGEDESDAMWKLYVTGQNGIAICSTYGRFKESFAKSAEKIMIGKIKYADYNRDSIPRMDTFSPFLHKKRSYRHESELRAIAWKPDHLESKFLDTDGRATTADKFHSAHSSTKYPDLSGIQVEVAISTLIDEVFVSPKAEAWFVDLVASIVKRYKYDLAIRKSDLYMIPKILGD